MFPGVGEDTFHCLLEYLYTDDIPTIAPERSADLIELANRLCLPRLINLTEQKVIQELASCSSDETIDHCLKLLEPSQVELKPWCHIEFKLFLTCSCTMHIN